MSEGFIHFDEMVRALCRWGASLPWVLELARSETGSFVRRFVIECPDLDCCEPWFAVDPMPDCADDGPQVLLIMPKDLAGRVVARGLALSIAHLDADCMIIAVALPVTSSELLALEQLLQVAYAAAFDRSGARPWGCS